MFFKFMRILHKKVLSKNLNTRAFQNTANLVGRLGIILLIAKIWRGKCGECTTREGGESTNETFEKERNIRPGHKGQGRAIAIEIRTGL